jgi:hypothetical protein
MKHVFVVLLVIALSAGPALAAGGKNRGTTGKGKTNIGTTSKGTATQDRLRLH